MGVSLRDVIGQLNEAWVDARANAYEELASGALEGNIESFAKGWTQFAVWERDEVVAVLVPPEDASEDLVVIEPREVAKLRLGQDVKLGLDRLAEVYADLQGHGQRVTDAIVEAQMGFRHIDKDEFIPIPEPSPGVATAPQAARRSRRNDRPFRIVEGDAIVSADFDPGHTLDDVIQYELEDIHEFLKLCDNPEQARDFGRSNHDRSIWRIDQHGTDRLLAVVRTLPDGSPNVVRFDVPSNHANV